MRPVCLISLLLLLSPLTVHGGAAPPVVTSIQPAAGPTAGGTLVTITGANLTLPPGFACILPCPTTVRFGASSAVDPLDEQDSRVTVRTPAHAAGTVELTLRTGDGRSVTVANAFTFVTGEESGYTAFLLPVYTDGDVPGAHGSLWRSEFWIRNNSELIALLAPWDCPPGQGCLTVFPLTRALQPNETLRGLPDTLRPPSANPGRMLYVSEQAASRLSPSLRLWDVSRQALDAGTELPVVRAADLHTGTTQLMAVPLDGNFRLMLRVYDTAHSESRFRVRIYAQPEGIGNEISLAEVDLVATTLDEGPFRLQPAYAQYAIATRLPLSTAPPSPARIEVEPLTPGSMFWTFVAVTNNDTQHVTLVTPQ
ncbi:MAG TPA: IPT/TIG domain-containing protein [Thermoanaerobaculia bacterium]|nr:IPT/TIG domain-containing protein [Thermoanaerobaculia bacterium]